MQPEADDWEDEDNFVPEEWMSLDEARGAMTKGSSYEYASAKSNLLELIADARLSLRSLQFFQEADVGGITLRGLKPLQIHTGQVEPRDIRHTARCAQEPMALPRSFFCRAERWRIDPDRVDWKAGTLVATRPTKMQIECEGNEVHPLTRLIATSVRVNIVDLDAIVKSVSGLAQIVAAKDESSAAPSPVNSRESGRKRGPDWEPWIAEVVIYVQKFEYDPSMSVAAFYKIIHQRLADRDIEGPNDAKVAKAIRAILNRWGQAVKDNEV